MPPETCPRCNHGKFWKIRRQRRRCSRCLYEWRPGPPLRMSRDEWRKLLSVYVGEMNQQKMMKAAGLHHQRIRRAIKLVQSKITQSFSNIFPYTSYRVQASRRGASSKTRIHVLGILGHGGQVWAQAVKREGAGSLLSIVRREMHNGAIVCSDLYQWEKQDGKSIEDKISHLPSSRNGNSNKSGSRSLLGLVGFWKWLEKNRIRSKRKIKMEQLPLYLSECVWKYNHRSLSIKQRVNRLMKLISQTQGN